MSHGAEKFSRRESFSVSLISGIEKFYASESYVTIFHFLSSFFVSQCRKFSSVNRSVLCFRNIPVAKKFMDKGRGGVSSFSVENFLSHSAEIFVREFFSVSPFLRTEKVWIKEGGASSFSVGTLLSHSTRKLHRGILLCFRKYMVSKKIKEERGRECQDFPSKNFCLAVPKNFVGESCSASLFSGIEKFYASER